MKLIFIDSDGTLRHSDGSISKKSISVIKELVNRGDIVSIASGRPRYHAISIATLAESSPIIVSSTGAEIYGYKHNKVIFSLYFPSNLVLKLIDCALSFDIRFLIEIDNNEYTTKDVLNDNEILLPKDYKNLILNSFVKQCMFIDPDLNKLLKVWEYVEDKLNIKVTDHYNQDYEHQEYWFSISNPKASKGEALKFLKDYYHTDETIAIGNGINDLSMLKEASLGVAVSNSSNAIKSVADKVIDSNDADGVATFLKTFL